MLAVNNVAIKTICMLSFYIITIRPNQKDDNTSRFITRQRSSRRHRHVTISKHVGK